MLCYFDLHKLVDEVAQGVGPEVKKNGVLVYLL